MRRCLRCAGLALACWVVLCGQAWAKRVALVVGNNAYQNVTSLKKAANDARTIAEILTETGFTVLRATNVDRRAFNQKLQDFATKLEPGDEALFYYAGHGVEINGRNFLLPVDIPAARPGQENLIKLEAIAIDRIIDIVRDRRARISILMLDACRDNPFKRDGTRSLGRSRGLALVEPPAGTFIMYSAGVGQQALDRLREDDPHPNSVYTRTLVPLLRQPGLALQKMARTVRQKVEALAGSISHSQRPAYYDEVTGDFFFVAPTSSGDEEKKPQEQQSETAFLGPAKIKKPAVTTVPSNKCDELAGEPWDAQVVGGGAEWRKLEQEALEAIRACRKAAAEQGGHVRFTFQLARALYAENRKEEALPLFEKAAKADHAAAISYLAYMYDHGHAVGQSTSRAFQEYLRAAKSGYVPAMNQLANFYLDGRGVGKSPKTSHAWQLKAAEKGFGPSMNAVGFNLQTGRGVKKNTKRAIEWYLKAAEAGVSTAMYNLGYLYREGKDTAQDFREARKWFKRAADKGHRWAMTSLGDLYARGLSVAKDLQEAHKWYVKAADAGDSAAMLNVAYGYATGATVAKDEQEAAKWYRKSADAGNAAAMSYLADLYFNGRGLRKDPAEGIKWIRRAVDKGHASSINSLGFFQEHGKHGLAKDLAASRKLYLRAAEKGNATAMHNLGYVYAEGRGVDKDPSQARKWFFKATERGNASSMTALGNMYYSGAGGTKDLAEARKWYAKAADAGDANGMNAMALMHIRGQGGAKDDARARAWFEKAARKGHVAAAINFAEMLLSNQGGAKNPAAARKWFESAAQKNNARALFWLGVMYDSPLGDINNPAVGAQYIYRAIKQRSQDAIQEVTQQFRRRSRRFRAAFQSLLRTGGYYRGRIDGAFGKSTMQAIQSLVQRGHNADPSQMMGGQGSFPPQSRGR
ncbi:MAG: caspase family protein [Methyloligellaceae bacterium]